MKRGGTRRKRLWHGWLLQIYGRLFYPLVVVGSSTTQQYDGPAGTLTAPHHSWSNGIDSIFRVRGKGYMQDRVKVPPGENCWNP